MKSAEIRRRFLDYFETRDHTVVPSASLVPPEDPTLLFVNAGMVPFKDVFLGKEKRSYTRAVSIQKCLRVSGKHNDLEEVGPSPQHQTFFEMLGNFSFGDYFKEEALAYSWEFLTKDMGLPPDALHPTVYVEDDESAKIWAAIKGIPESRVVRLGAEDNFWSMGDTGPCGPNSEIIYDRAGACLNDGSDCALTCECGRWWEVWNNVFMQFDRAADGTLTPLPKTGVDTGMGFERLVSIVQDVRSNYENDVFAPLIDRIRELTGEGPDIAAEQLPHYRAIADHARAISFLIADGVMPSNEGRGYVLRRVLRRAAYQGRLLGLERAFFSGICRGVIDVMGEAYPELVTAAGRIADLVDDEEERFLATLDAGLSRLEEIVRSAEAPLKSGGGAAREQMMLAGDEAFRLYDTYGFPLDLTRTALHARGWAVDEDGFNAALEAQRTRGREARAQEQDEALLAAARGLDATGFRGYETLAADGTLSALFTEAGAVETATEGQDVEVILDATPFYAESGGQVGDRGEIAGPNGAAEIDAVRRVAHGVFVHTGRVVRGNLAQGDTVTATVDEASRRDIMRNHTATHLLHRALRNVLGEQAKQAGSLVAPERLRFDFMHNKALTDSELRETERIVREQIVADRGVETNVMPLRDALAMNADAMFDEKYGEEARVVSVGAGADAAFSRELCGGTHCRATGEIGAFFITEQRSVGAGVRRVEAVTGLAAFDWADARRDVADRLSREYNVPVEDLPERIRAIQQRASKQPKQAAAGLPDPAALIDAAERRNGALLIVARIDAAHDADALRAFGDGLRSKATSAAIALGAVLDDKPTIAIMLTQDRVEAGLHAGKIAKQVGAEMGAGGGGRPDTATAGGRDPAMLDAGLAKAKELLAGGP